MTVFKVAIKLSSLFSFQIYIRVQINVQSSFSDNIISEICELCKYFPKLCNNLLYNPPYLCSVIIDK